MRTKLFIILIVSLSFALQHTTTTYTPTSGASISAAGNKANFDSLRNGINQCKDTLNIGVPRNSQIYNNHDSTIKYTREDTIKGPVSIDTARTPFTIWGANPIFRLQSTNSGSDYLQLKYSYLASGAEITTGTGNLNLQLSASRNVIIGTSTAGKKLSVSGGLAADSVVAGVINADSETVTKISATKADIDSFFKSVCSFTGGNNYSKVATTDGTGAAGTLYCPNLVSAFAVGVPSGSPYWCVSTGGTVGFPKFFVFPSGKVSVGGADTTGIFSVTGLTRSTTGFTTNGEDTLNYNDTANFYDSIYEGASYIARALVRIVRVGALVVLDQHELDGTIAGGGTQLQIKGIPSEFLPSGSNWRCIPMYILNNNTGEIGYLFHDGSGGVYVKRVNMTTYNAGTAGLLAGCASWVK
jgi:hypothetical protein